MSVGARRVVQLMLDKKMNDMLAMLKYEFAVRGYTRTGHVGGDTWHKERDFMSSVEKGYWCMTVFDNCVIAVYSWAKGMGYSIERGDERCLVTADEFIIKLLAELYEVLLSQRVSGGTRHGL